MKSQVEEVIEEDQFGFRKGKDTRDAIGLIKIMSESVLDDIKEDVCLLHRLAKGFGPCSLDQTARNA